MPRKGRKRSGAPRHPGGKLIQATEFERAEKIVSVAIEARARVYALARESAASMPETSVLGRLLATGEISKRQFDAGTGYRHVVQMYDRAMLARGLPRPGDLNRFRHHDASDGTEEEYRKAFDKAVRDFDACAAALRDAAREDRLAPATVNAVAVSDLSVPQLTDSLRVGLNALAQALRIPREDEGRAA